MERTPSRFVDELERVTAELAASDPLAFDRLAALVERRGEAIAALAASPEALDAAAAARLQVVFAQGAAYEQTLEVARASVRHQLAELYRAGFQARALAGMAGAEPGSGGWSVEG